MTLIIIVPCFNEAHRFDADRFRQLLSFIPEARLWFINDGSADRTLQVLNDFASTMPDRVKVTSLPTNVGKGEAIRHGILAAVTEEPNWVAYIDADLATPPEEVHRLWDEHSDNSSLDVFFGSRIRLCGSRIERREGRHIVGRLFANLAARTLSTQVYDTQAGAKFFRSTPELALALAVPFCDRWSFDVELLGRLGRLGVFPNRAMEAPLRSWRDVPATSMSLRQGFRSVLSLWQVRRAVRMFPS